MYKSTLLLILSFYSLSVIAQTNNRIDGEIIIQLSSGSEIDATIQKINQENNFTLEINKPLSERFNIWLLNFNSEINTGEKIIDVLWLIPQVANVQFNHTLQSRATPNDDSYPAQWNMFNDGTGGGIADADVDADEAWDITTGGLTISGDTIVIAIVDNGFDLGHEDLSFFKNYDEIPLNLIDDDGNGYVDDFDGWNSTDNNGIIPSFNHGTHVTGIAGAKGNNGIGVAGINWNVKVLPVKCNVIESEVIASYAYVFDMREQYDISGGEKGAYIVSTNSSFGIDFAFPEDYPVWCAMYDSLGQLGILSAAATNNSMTNIDVVGDMPTACVSEFLISVTNTDKADNLKAAYGVISIDIGAPGDLIQSTFPNDTYGAQTGTSMASPHVAGAVALLFSAACEKFIIDYAYNPPAMSLLLKEYILNGVDFTEDLNGVCVSNGRLNLYNSLQNLITGYCELEIPSLNNGHLITVFPNPADQFLYIDSEDEFSGELNIFIFDETLRVIYSDGIFGFEELKNGIRVSDFSNGIYFLKIGDINNNTIYTSGFVLQH